MSKVYFNQRDSRWANKMYSSTGNQSQTIKSSGCGPTASAMVISSLTNNIVYPDTMANYYVDNGYRSPSNGTYWSAFNGTAKKYNLDFKQTTDINIVIDCIKNGGMTLVSSRAGSDALFSTNGHFIVLLGIQNNNFIIYDSDLYNGKYETSIRKPKVVLNGIELYVSFENVKTEALQYFCFYNSNSQNNNIISTKAKYVKVNTALNIRSGAGIENSVVGTLSNNTLVTVFEELNGFSRIGNSKWVSSEYLSDSPSVNYTSKVMTVTPKIGLNVRTSPSINAKIVTAYPQGTRVTIYEITNGWARGIKGWMSSKYLS